MRSTIEEAFIFDYNTLIEEEQYDFYTNLSPYYQTQLIQQLFGDFIHQFWNFFEGAQAHFINELVTNMYARILDSYVDMIKYHKKVKEIFFITQGRVVMRYGVGDQRAFSILP